MHGNYLHCSGALVLVSMAIYNTLYLSHPLHIVQQAQVRVLSRKNSSFLGGGGWGGGGGGWGGGEALNMYGRVPLGA